MSGSSETGDNTCPRRKALKTAVSALCLEAGFSSAKDNTLETLTEMMQSFVFELGRSSRAFSELSCRTEPLMSDVIMALIEMGLDVRKLPAYAKRPNKTVLVPPVQNSNPHNPRLLQVGNKRKHSSHIPDYLPAFPDPHTYIKTQTHKEPEKEYQSLREKAATQKRDVERALTRFIAKTGETESLFPDDPYAYPLIANKPKPLPYLDCLMPKEEDLASSNESGEAKPSPSLQPASPHKIHKLEAEVEKAAVSNDSQTAAKSQDGVNTAGGATPVAGAESTETDSNSIDNPYLREIKMPKLKGAGKKSTSIQAMSSSTKWSF